MNFFGIDSPFARGIGKLVQMLYVGVLWFVCSLPVVTVGAASTAMFEVLLKMEKDREGYLARSFFQAFGRNLKSATLVWLPILAAQVVFAVNLFYYGVFGGGTFLVQSVAFAILLGLSLLAGAYAFPVLARFENTWRGTFRMVFQVAVRNAGWSVLMLLAQVFAVFVCWFFLYIPLLFFMGVVGYFQAGICNHIFDRMIEEGEICEEE